MIATDSEIELQIARTLANYSSSGDVKEWPEPMPLEGELPAVKQFDERALPELFRSLVCDVADRTQVPLDFPAAVVVLALAGATGRRARIQPKAKDHSWIVVPNLWGGIVAPPGQLKSPIINEITRPLRMIESGFRKSHEAAMDAHQESLQEHELHFAAWKEKFKAASKSGKAAPPRPERAPEVPTSQSLIVNDATMEALHKKMQSSPAGILVIRDELTGWLAQLDKPGREGERAFALSAWNGDTSHTVDRITRGEVHVEHCCMSLLGGIQPSRLRSYLSEALTDGPSNDGLIQRFQVTVWPDTFTGKYVDRAPGMQFAEEAAEVFSRIVGMDPEHSRVYQFEPKAQNLFEEWYIRNDAKAKSEKTHPAMSAHLAKYRSLMPSLALLFELAEGGGEGEVSLKHTMQAEWWCNYLESHANRIYSAIVSPHIRAAQELAGKIKARKLGAAGTFAIREVYLKGWTGLDTPDLARLAAETLADAGWIRKIEAEAGAAGGRPANRYEVNPRIWSGASGLDHDSES
jgi:putative DNA primase/helicase